MRYCKKCVMPDTRPGIQFNKDGVCSACQAYENRKNIDWTKRMEEFQALCDRHRGGGGGGRGGRRDCRTRRQGHPF